MSSSVPNCSGSGCTSFGANYREGVFCSFHAAELGLQRHSGQCWRCQGLERRVDDRGAAVTVMGVELPRPFSQIENRLPVVGDHVVTLVEWMGWMGNSFALVVAVNLESQTASIHLSCDSVADLKFGQFVICGVAKAAPQAASAAPARPSDSIASHDYFDDRDLQEAIAASMGIGRFGNVVDDEQNSDVQRAIQASLGLGTRCDVFIPLMTNCNIMKSGSYLPPSKVEDVHFSAVDPPLKVGCLRLPVCHTRHSAFHVFFAELCGGPLVHSGSLWLHCFGFQFHLRSPHTHVQPRRPARACPSACFAHYDFVNCDAVCRLPALQQGSPFEGAGAIYNHNTCNFLIDVTRSAGAFLCHSEFARLASFNAFVSS
jgi:hypothetical protein